MAQSAIEKLQEPILGERENIIKDAVMEMDSKTLSESKEITVGAGKDFETLQEAMEWVEGITQTSNTIKFVLDDGIHALLQSDSEVSQGIYTFKPCAHFLNKKVIIDSASQDKTLCIITADVNSIEDSTQTILFHNENSTFSISNVTMDGTVGGLTISNPLMNVSGGNSFIEVQNCTVDQGIGIGGLGSTFIIENSTFDQSLNAIAVGSSKVQMAGGEISNALLQAISVTENSFVQLDAVTLTTNVADGNIPFNEIQYSGSCISTNSSALSFKA